jgi:Organic solute transporter Ostalpha
MVVRIMVMVPLYGVSSLIALFSLEAAFVIDVIRDIYEVCNPRPHRFILSVDFWFRPSLSTVSLVSYSPTLAENGHFSYFCTADHRRYLFFRSAFFKAKSTQVIRIRFYS